MTQKQFEKAVNEIHSLTNTARRRAEELKDGLQEYFDAKSETWQEGDKGAEYQGKIDVMESVCDGLSDVLSELEDVIS